MRAGPGGAGSSASQPAAPQGRARYTNPAWLKKAMQEKAQREQIQRRFLNPPPKMEWTAFIKDRANRGFSQSQLSRAFQIHKKADHYVVQSPAELHMLHEPQSDASLGSEAAWGSEVVAYVVASRGGARAPGPAAPRTMREHVADDDRRCEMQCSRCVLLFRGMHAEHM